MKFADWLLARLANEGWTQAELAARSRLSKQAINNYIGGRTPDKHAIGKIAAAFRLKPETVYRAAMGKSPNPESDPWVDEIAHKASLLSPTFRGVVDKFIDSLLEGEKENTSTKAKPRKKVGAW